MLLVNRTEYRGSRTRTAPQIKHVLVETRGSGFGRIPISEIANNWVNGKGLEAITREYSKREAWQEFLGTAQK